MIISQCSLCLDYFKFLQFIVWFDDTIIVHCYYHTLFNDLQNSLCFVFVWCPCMAINISVQYSGGLLPDIILLT